MTAQRHLRASVALAAYAEPLLEGRRVLVFGDASSGLAEQLVDRGARLVNVFDPERARVAEAAARGLLPNVSVAPLDDGPLAVRDAAFDLALVDNLVALGDPKKLLERLRRALAPRGAALIASPNPEVSFRLLAEPGPAGLDYYALYDLIAAEFDSVRMLGQTPFVGYAVVDLAAQDEDPAPTLDTGLLPTGAEEPDYFLALASARPLELEAFHIIQVPFRSVVGGGRARELEAQLSGLRRAEHAARERAEGLQARVEQLEQRAPEPQASSAQLAQHEAWIGELERRATAADERADEAEGALETERAEFAARLAERTQELQELVERLAARDAQLMELGAQLAARDAQLVELGAQLAARDAQLVELGAQLAARDAQLAELGAQLAARDAQLGERATQQETLTARLARVEGELEAERQRSADPDPSLGADVQALEAALKERGERVAQLQAELRSSEQLGRELLLELETLRLPEPSLEPPAAAEPSAGMTSRLAELETELTAARWRVTELQARSATAAERQAALERARAAALAR